MFREVPKIKAEIASNAHGTVPAAAEAGRSDKIWQILLTKTVISFCKKSRK
jgi:hypothetical protein